MAKQSAGILLYRQRTGVPEVLLVHPGGPFWEKKDSGVWSIPKGECEEGEDLRACALRAAEEVATELREAASDGSIATAVAGDELGGDVVVLAVYYPDARGAVEQYRDQLSGEVVVDITNPVNDTFDALVVPSDSSATQELSELAPGAQWVKAFNTTFAGTLSAGEVAGQPLDVLIAADEDDAKATVSTLVRDGGLNPIDAGPRHRARELEALGLLHMTLQDRLGTASEAR